MTGSYLQAGLQRPGLCPGDGHPEAQGGAGAALHDQLHHHEDPGGVAQHRHSQDQRPEHPPADVRLGPAGDVRGGELLL